MAGGVRPTNRQKLRKGGALLLIAEVVLAALLMVEVVENSFFGAWRIGDAVLVGTMLLVLVSNGMVLARIAKALR